MSTGTLVLGWIGLGGAAIVLGTALAREVARDGYGVRPAPRSHPGEPLLAGAYGRFRLPAASAALRGVRLVGGLLLYGTAIALIVRAHLGVDPWDVLAQGVAAASGLPFGVVTNGIGALVLLLWVPLRQRPGVGTVANVLLVGSAAQVVLDVVPPVGDLLVRAGLLVLGIVLLAIATAIYLGTGLGAGPRDGLMVGLRRRLGVPLWLGRTLIEGTVLLAGWLLGGDVGIGTVVFAATIGPLCGLAVRLLPPGRVAETKVLTLRDAAASPARLEA